MFALRWLFAVLLILVARVDAADSPVVSGELRVEPTSVRLTHVRQPHSLVVTVKTNLGESVDLTTEAKYASGNEKIARARNDGWIEPVADGTTEIKVAAAGKTVTVKVVVD